MWLFYHRSVLLGNGKRFFQIKINEQLIKRPESHHTELCTLEESKRLPHTSTAVFPEGLNVSVVPPSLSKPPHRVAEPPQRRGSSIQGFPLIRHQSLSPSVTSWCDLSLRCPLLAVFVVFSCVGASVRPAGDERTLRLR